MKLYTFHKVARPLTDYLNRLGISFKFISNGFVHALVLPYHFILWPKFRALIESCGLCYQYDKVGLLIF